jgi:hypothetical protein
MKEMVAVGAFMAKKNSLREVRAKSLSRNEEIFAYSDYWEAWEQVGEDGNDPENWEFIADGSLSDCIEALSLIISIELDRAMQDEKKRLGVQYDDFFGELARRHRQKQEDIKKVCLKTGEYKGEGWTIRSQLTRSQCAWKEKHGDTGFER